jgi:transcriptional regulator with XRE-family HTH domain
MVLERSENMKNEILYTERKKKNMSTSQFAEFIGIPARTYISYEECLRVPRPKVMQIIMEKLDLKDTSVFFPSLHITEDETENNENVIQNICDYMNSMSRKRYYNVYEVSMIRRAVRAEYLERKFKKVKINSKSEEGKKHINESIAAIANAYMRSSQITSKDVELFKRCKIFEYENRTYNAKT